MQTENVSVFLYSSKTDPMLQLLIQTENVSVFLYSSKTDPMLQLLIQTEHVSVFLFSSNPGHAPVYPHKVSVLDRETQRGYLGHARILLKYMYVKEYSETVAKNHLL